MFHARPVQENGYFIFPKHLQYAFKFFGTEVVSRKIKKEIDPQTLETFDLSHTGIDDGIVGTLIDHFIARDGSKLRELNLSGNNFTDTGIRALLQAFKASSHCQLEKLVITGNPNLSEDIIQQTDNYFTNETKLKT